MGLWSWFSGPADAVGGFLAISGGGLTDDPGTAEGRSFRLSDLWSGSATGTQTFVMDGLHVTVFPVPQEWRFSIVAIGDPADEVQVGGPFRTQASAKLAAVKAFLRRT